MRMYESQERNTGSLPKWASRSLRHMERDIAALDARIEELQNTDVAETDTRARPGSSLDWYALPPNQQYEFDLEDGTTIQVAIRKEWNGLWLSVNALHGQLEVAPRSSNLIYVRGAKD